MMVGIQADDLTGACDTGAPFAVRGLETLVVVHDGDGLAALARRQRGRPRHRHRDSGAVGRGGARAGRARPAPSSRPGRPASSTRRSTPRSAGSVAAEIDGMLDGVGLGLALLTPAFPAQRRTVVDGWVRVDGRLGSTRRRSRATRRFPRTGASLLGLLAAGGVRPAAALPLGTVRRGRDAVAARLERFGRSGGRVLAADAETDADLVGAGGGGPAAGRCSSPDRPVWRRRSPGMRRPRCPAAGGFFRVAPGRGGRERAPRHAGAALAARRAGGPRRAGAAGDRRRR